MEIGTRIKIKGDVLEIPSSYFFDEGISGENGTKFILGGRNATRLMKDNEGIIIDKYADWNMIQYTDVSGNVNILGVKDEYLEEIESPKPVIEEIVSNISLEEEQEIINKFFV